MKHHTLHADTMKGSTMRIPGAPCGYLVGKEIVRESSAEKMFVQGVWGGADALAFPEGYRGRLLENCEARILRSDGRST